jgi:glutathione S-transferase
VITLYLDGYFVSPLDACCTIALDEKRVEYQTARALLRDGQGIPPALGARTLISRVPACQHGDFYLSESLAIVEYIEDTFAAPDYPRLLPADLHMRARARQLMAYVRFDLHQLREERPWWTCIYPADLAPMSPAAAQEAAELVKIAEKMIPELGEFNIAHADLALQLMRLRKDHGLPEPLRHFVETTIARPSVRSYLEHSRPPNPPPRAVGLG